MNLTYLQKLGPLTQPDPERNQISQNKKTELLNKMESGKEYTLQGLINLGIKPDTAKKASYELYLSGDVTRRKGRIKYAKGWYYTKVEK